MLQEANDELEERIKDVQKELEESTEEMNKMTEEYTKLKVFFHVLHRLLRDPTSDY